MWVHIIHSKIWYVSLWIDGNNLCLDCGRLHDFHLEWPHEYASQTFKYRVHNSPRALTAGPRNPSPHLNQCYISMGYSQTMNGHSKDTKAGAKWKVLRRSTWAQTLKGLAYCSFLRLPSIQRYSQHFSLLFFTWIRLALWSRSLSWLPPHFYYKCCPKKKNPWMFYFILAICFKDNLNEHNTFVKTQNCTFKKSEFYCI